MFSIKRKKYKNGFYSTNVHSGVYCNLPLLHYVSSNKNDEPLFDGGVASCQEWDQQRL